MRLRWRSYAKLTEKKCKRCGIVKPRSEFKMQDDRGYIDDHCLACYKPKENRLIRLPEYDGEPIDVEAFTDAYEMGLLTEWDGSRIEALSRVKHPVYGDGVVRCDDEGVALVVFRDEERWCLVDFLDVTKRGPRFVSADTLSKPPKLPVGGCLTCTRCKASKPVEKFGKDKQRVSGYSHYCRDCENARNRASYQKRKMGVAGG